MQSSKEDKRMKKRFGRIFNAILILAITLALCPAVQTMAEEDVSAYIMDGTVITGYSGAGGDITPSGCHRGC